MPPSKPRKTWADIELCDREPLPAWLTDLWWQAYEGTITWEEFTELALMHAKAEEGG